MKNQKMRLIIGVVLGVVVLFYIGAMFGFFPFTICDDLVIRAVAFCTLIICLVIAVCTFFIIDFLDKLVDCLEKCLIYRHIRRFAD